MFRSDAAVKWLKCIILLHAAHLISNPEISEVFSPMFPIIEGRLNMMASLYRLSGRLDLVIGQLEDRTNNTVKMFENISSQPRLTYQDKGIIVRIIRILCVCAFIFLCIVSS